MSDFTPTLSASQPQALTQLSHSTLNALRELLQEGEAQNTVRSYQSAMRYWAGWHQFRTGQAITLPLSVETLLLFIADHAQRSTPYGLRSELPPSIDHALVQSGCKAKLGPPSHNTLVHRVAVMSKAHQNRGLPNPCHDERVRELLSRTRKAYAKRGEQAQKKSAITKEVLQKLLATCDDSLRGLRDRALLLFAWSSGGRRRSEVSQADMQYLRQIGPDEYLYQLAFSKTNQSGADLPENIKPVLGLAGQALSAWLQASGITEGAIFRRIRKGGHLGEPLQAAAVRTIVLERCALAGVEGNFSAHSLRSGFVTEAGKRNVPLAETMALTGHQSVATVLGYFRAESVIHNQAAKLMDSEET